jgi:hypothetical protein
MKNAKPRLTNETASLRGWKQIERDTMPASVATDLLCTLERLSNPEAKAYHSARVTLWHSIEEPRPRETKLVRKYSKATLMQLGKWNRRAAKRRRGLQYKYAVAVALPEESNLQLMRKNRLVAALDFAAGLVDQVIDGTAIEINHRI